MTGIITTPTADIAAWFERKCNSAVDNVAAARQSLAVRAAAGASPDDLVTAAHGLVKTDAVNRAYARLAHAFNYDHAAGVEHVEATIMDLLLSGADDTWSGRGNDARRVAHEGTIEACRKVREMIAYDWTA